MNFIGANANPLIAGIAALPGETVTGPNGEGLSAAELTFAQVRYDEVYSGIDLIYYGRGGELEYDWIVDPGADPDTIRMSFSGAFGIEIEADGDLNLHTVAGDLVQSAPVLYQEVGGQRRPVDGHFELRGGGPDGFEVGFEVGAYDPSLPLVIDPIFGYSTYLGGSRNEVISLSATDAAGNTYVLGTTNSLDLGPDVVPETGNSNAFWAKYDAQGREQYRHVIASASEPGQYSDSGGAGLALGADGTPYVLVVSHEFTFDVNGGAPTSLSDMQLHLLALAPDGLPVSDLVLLKSDTVFSTEHQVYAVGATGMIAGPDGALYVAALQLRTTAAGGAAEDDFIIKVKPDAGIVFKQPLFQAPEGLRVDTQQNIYLAFSTDRSDLPVSGNAIRAKPAGSTDTDIYLQALDPTATGLLWGTYLGGSANEYVGGMTMDPAQPGVLYLAGNTSSADFPMAVSATTGLNTGFQPTLHPLFAGRTQGLTDGFVAVVDLPRMKLLASTYLGGGGDDALSGIALDAVGNVYVSGQSNSPDFPVANPLYGTYSAGESIRSYAYTYDFVIAKLNATLSTLQFSTYLGGSGHDSAQDFNAGRTNGGPKVRVDAAGTVHVTGTTSSLDFPVLNAQQPDFAGGIRYSGGTYNITREPSDGVVLTLLQRGALVGLGGRATVGREILPIVATFANPRLNSSPADFAVTIDWGDGTQSPGLVERSGGAIPVYLVYGIHTYDEPGAYPVLVTVRDRVNDALSPLLNLNLTHREGSQIAPAMAQDPTFLRRLVSVATTEPPLVGGAGPGIILAISTNGGENWAPRLLADGHDTLPLAMGSPDVLFDTFGNLYIAYLSDAGKVVLLTSKDGGKRFGDEPLKEFSLASLSPELSRPRLAWNAARNELWLSVMDSASGELMVAASKISGLGQIDFFTTLTSNVGEGAGDVDIAAGPDGGIAIVWEQQQGDGTGMQLKVQFDEDGLGDRLPTPVLDLLTANRVGDVTVPALPDLPLSLSPVLAWDNSSGPHRGRLYVGYHDLALNGTGVQVEGDLDAYLIWSDDGATWADPVRIAGDAAGQQFLPTVAVDQSTGVLAAAWYDTQIGPDAVKVFFTVATSADGGATFSTPRQVAKESSDLPLGRAKGPGPGPRIVFANQALHAVWADSSSLRLENNSDGDYEIATQTLGIIDVTPARVQIRPNPIAAVKGADFNGTVATFTIEDNSREPDDFSASIEWGDGGKSAGAVSQPGGAGTPFTVTGNHVYAAVGAYPIWVTVTDAMSGLETGAVSNVTALQGSQTETTIAIDPHDPNRVFAAANDNSGRSASGMAVAASADGGVTWTSDFLGDGSDGFPPSQGDPKVAYDPFGNLYLTYLTKTSVRGVAVLLSENNGLDFRLLTVLQDPLDSADQPSITVGPGRDGLGATVWLTWERGDEPFQIIMAAGAEVTGLGAVGAFQQRFVAPLHGDGQFRNFGDIAIGPKGEVVLSYARGIAGAPLEGPSQIVTQTDPDGLGPLPFGPEVLVTDTKIGAHSPIAAQARRAIDSEGNLAWDRSDGAHAGRLYLVYTDAKEAIGPNGLFADTDVLTRYSDDQGQTWSEPIDVAGFDTGSAFFPSIAIDQSSGNLGISWYDSVGPNAAQTRYTATISDDGGVTWNRMVYAVAPGPSDASVATLDPRGFTNQYGDYTGLDFVGGILQPIWADNSLELEGNPDPRRFEAASARIAIATVFGPPLVMQGVAITGTAGTPVNAVLATFTDPEGARAASSYKASIDWGDGTALSPSVGAGVVSKNEDGSFTVRAEHEYKVAGSFTAKVVVNGPSTRGEAHVKTEIAKAPKTVTFADDGRLRVVREVEFSKVLAVLKDGNHNSKAADFDVSIAWGDGSFSDGVVALTSAGAAGAANVFSITGKHNYISEQTYAVQVSVRVKADGEKLTTSGALVNGDPPMTLDTTNDIIDALAGISVGDRILAVFTVEGDIQADVGEYIASINWGDGTVDANVHPFVNRTDGITVVGRHTYADAGQYYASVTVVDDSGNVATAPLVNTVEPDVTSQIKALGSGLVYDPSQDRFVGDLTITNISGSDIDGPLYVLIKGLPDGVTLDSTDQQSGAGDPLFKIDQSRLAAGASLEPIALEFSNPGKVPISYTVQVFDGIRMQAPAGAPLVFEPNRGQANAAASFIARGQGYAIGLSSTGASLLLGGSASQAGAAALMELVGANTSAVGSALEAQAGVSNYLRDDQAISGVPHFARVRYVSVYAGVDLEYYGRDGVLEYDWIVHPGADANSIAIRFAGIDGMQTDSAGNLRLRIGSGELVQRAPVAYQLIGGVRHDVSASFDLRAGGTVGLALGAYDASVALVIDPVLVYSTYLGGSSYEDAVAVAVDAQGNTYLTGTTTSSDFFTVRAFDPELNDPATVPFYYRPDAYVTKLDANGVPVYSTYLGGDANKSVFGYGTSGLAIAVGADGRVWTAGLTDSATFPQTDAEPAGGLPQLPPDPQGIPRIRPYLTQLAADGSAVLYSTLFSFGSTLRDLALDGRGGLYATGENIGRGVFALKLDTTRHEVDYLTYLGGGNFSFGIAADASGQAYLTGWTTQRDFPTVNALYPNPLTPLVADSRYQQSDGFLAKLAGDGQVLFSTYYGGSGGVTPYDIAVDPAGSIVVVGETGSTDLPVPGAVQATPGGGRDGFLLKFANDGSRVLYGTYIGGSEYDRIKGVAVDAAGRAYVGGSTGSDDLATRQAFQPAYSGGANNPSYYRESEGFAGALSADGSAFGYLTYLGGSRFDEVIGVAADAAGNASFVGRTNSTDFATRQAAQTRLLGTDAFVTRILAQDDGTIALRNVPVQALAGSEFSGLVAVFTTNGTEAAGQFSASIDWGDGAISAGVISGNFRDGFRVTGTHLYATEGTRDLLVTLLDAAGRSVRGANSAQAEADGIARYRVSVDTTLLSGGAGLLGVEFNPGALPGAPDAQAVIRNLRITGGTLGALSLEGGASGDAASEAVLQPTAVLNRLLNALTFGSRIEFDLEFSGPALAHPAGGSFADVFALQLLAVDGRTPLLASDATGSLLRIDVLPNATTRARPADAAVYAASLGQATVSRPSTRLNLTLLPFSIQEGQPYAGQLGTFTSSDLTQTAGQFTASIDWGDGSMPTPGTVSGTAGHFTLAGSHTYATTGNYRLAVTLSDADGSAVLERSPLAGVGALEASPAVLATGSQLRPPLLADLNGDGLLDVVSSDWLTSTKMVVRLGQGGFTFGAAIDLPASAKTGYGYAAGDFNGDGKTDLVMAGETGGIRSVSVLLGDGGGHFSDGPAGSVIAPAAASITTSDLDEDGRLDVIIGSGFSSGANLPGQLLVLRGRGDGSFDAPVARGVGAGNMTAVAADMNRDGHVDLVVGGTFGSSLQVLLGDGTGALMPLPNLLVSALGVFSVVDVNADAVPDILAADGDLAVFVGQGDGTFSATRQSLGRPLGSVAVAADLDADGRAELIYAEAGTNSGTALNVLRAGADGRFVVFDSVAVPNGVTLLSAADFNGDGKLDVAMDVGTEVRLVTGRGDATLIAPSTVLAPDLARAVIALDSNGDGRLDLVSAGEGGVSVQLNQGGGFDDPARISAGGTVLNTVLLGDIDGDGRDDIVAGSATGISVLLRRADGAYAQPVSIGIGRVTDLALGDINGDGALDVAASIPGNGLVSGVSGVAILLNNGSGGLAFSEMVGARTGLGNGSGPGTLLLHDLNDDGKADLVARLDGDYNGSTFVNGGLGISLSTGSVFGTQSIVPAGADYARARNGIAAGDVDGDGKVDLVTVASGFSFVANTPLAQNGLFVLLGNGDGSFRVGNTYLADSLPVTTQLGSLALADLNHDGRLDIVATRHVNFNTDSPGDTAVLLGAGDGTFGPAMTYDGAGQARQLQVGDIDGDGVPDLVINEFTSDPAKSGANVLLGVGDGSFGRRTTYYAGQTSVFAVGDVDGDGKLDVLATDAKRGDLTLLRGRGDGTLTAPVFSLVGHTPASLTAVDFNGDAYPDLAFLSNLGKVGLLIGRGDGSFDLRTPVVIAGGGEPGIALRLSDINGDGLRELVVGFGAIISVSLDAAGNAGTPVTRAAALGFNSLTTLGDFDSDGVLDAMDVHREFGNNHGLAVLRRGLGNGSFAAGPSVDIGANTKAVMAGDLNNDGHLDLVFSNEGDRDSNLNYSGSLTVMLGNGDGTFQTPFNAAQSMPFGALALTDLDGDGYLDIAAVKGAFTRSERGLAVLLNHQDGTFAPPTVYDTGTATSVALGVLLGADLAGDGAPELIFAEGNRDGLLRILQNRPTRVGITVSNAPLAVTGRTLNPVAGVVFTAVIGTLTDDNPLAPAADHSASIDWGDGSRSAATIAADGQGGFSLTGSHLYATAGVRSIGIAAADRAGGNASGGGRANVGAGDLALTAEGIAVEAMAQTPFEGPVARFSDADPNGGAGDFRARIDWGDGSETAGLVVAAAGNGFEVRGQHVYEGIGAYTLGVAITDIGGSITSASSRAAVGRPPNHAPVALDDHVVTLEDMPVAFDVRRNDSDADRELLRVLLLAGPSHGSLEQLGDGSFIYRPDFNQAEGDSFTYRVEDAAGAMSQARVDIALTPLNDAPLLAPIADQRLAAGQTLSLQAQAADPDIGDPLSFVLDQAPAGATIDAGGLIQWGTGDTGGTASFVVRVTDQAGAAATRAFEAVTLAAVNRPPVAVADTAATNEEMPVVVNVLANDSDPEGNPLTAILVDAPAHGDVANNADGSFTYTPTANYQGPDSFSYKANDGSLDGNLASVTLTVNAVNDKPTATAITTQNVDEGQTLSLGVVGHDEDGDALSYSLLPGSVGGIDAATGVYSFAALDGNAGYTVSVRVSDGQGPDSFFDLSFGIEVHNVAPSLAISGAASGIEGQAYSLSLAHSDPGADSLSGWTINWGDATVSGAAGNASTASHTYATPGNFHISAGASDEDGSWVANSIDVTIAPMSFRVTAFTLADSGFHLDFNQVFQLGTLNLYTAAGNPIMGAADLVLTRLGAAGPIRGSLVPDADHMGASFIKTHGVFDAGAYTLTLASRADAWKDAAGRLLDGNGDGTAGDNYTATFTVAASSSALLSLGEVLAGPGQSLTGYAPLNQIPLDGLPITLSNASGVTRMSFDLAYAPSLLNISSVGFAVGVTGSYNLTTPGVISISLTTPALGAGAVDLVRLYGSVPANSHTLNNYGAKQVLDLYNVTSTRVLRVDDGLMVNAYPGDASGNAAYDTLDTTTMLRVISAADTGFGAWPLVDSSVIADINRDKSFSAIDRILLDAEINWLVTGNATKNRKEIVTLPAGLGPITFTGADPLVDIPRDLTATAGGLVSVPVRLDLADDLEQVQLQLAWDASQLELVEVRRGSLTGNFGGNFGNYVENRQAGSLYVDMSSLTRLVGGQGTLLELVFRVSATASGAVDVDLQWAQLNQTRLTLNPAPQLGADPTDGVIRVNPPALPTPPNIAKPQTVGALPSASPVIDFGSRYDGYEFKGSGDQGWLGDWLTDGKHKKPNLEALRIQPSVQAKLAAKLSARA